MYVPSVDYWPASLRSLTFLQSKSQALDVELRSCSLKDRRSFSLTEFLLDDIANPPLFHNNDVHLLPQNKAGINSPMWNHLLPACDLSLITTAKVSLALGSHTRLSTFFWGKIELFPSCLKVKLTKPLKVGKNDNKAEDRFSHLTVDVRVYVRLHVCVKGLGRNGRRGVVPSSAAGKTNLTESWSWVAKLKYSRRENQDRKQCSWVESFKKRLQG